MDYNKTKTKKGKKCDNLEKSVTIWKKKCDNLECNNLSSWYICYYTAEKLKCVFLVINQPFFFLYDIVYGKKINIYFSPKYIVIASYYTV